MCKGHRTVKIILKKLEDLTLCDLKTSYEATVITAMCNNKTRSRNIPTCSILVFDLAPKQFNSEKKRFPTSGAGVIICMETADLTSYTKCNLSWV